METIKLILLLDIYQQTIYAIFLFMVRVQFPKSKSIAEVIRARYANTITRIQILQKLDCCLCKVELDLEFLCKCNNNSVEAKFLNSRVASNHLKYSSTYNQCQSNLLREKICQKKTTVPILQKENLVLLKHLYKWASFDWFDIASTLFFWINAKISKLKSLAQQENFYKLVYKNNGERS